MTITYHAGRRIQGLSTDILETPTQSFDFSSSTGWTQTGSNINISGGKLNWIGDRTVSNNAISYDLGSSANANSWVLDFNITLTNYSAGSATYTHRLGIMLSSLGSSSSSNIQRQYIGCDLAWRTVEDALYRKFYAKDDNNNTQTWADNTPYNTPDDSTAHNFPVQGQTYNIKIIKLTSTTYKVEIINTANSAIFDTLTGTCSSTGLRYILIQNYSESTDGNPAFDGTIDDMKFYNGVSSLTSKPTNVQTGSRFEETDTRKIYFYKDPLTLDYGFPDSTNWNTEGTSGKMTISGGKLSFSSNAQSIDARQWYPLGFSVTGNFIMDFTLTQNTATPVASGQAVTMQIGISSFNTGASGEAPSTSAYTQLVISGYPSGDAYINAHKGDGAWSYDTSVRNWGFVTTNSTPIIRYIRISRVNNALTFKAYSDSTRLTQVGSTLSGLSMSNTFNYLFLKVYTQASSNSWNFDLDDIKFYNGTTSTAIWTEES